MLGNPVTHPEIEENYRIPFSHGMSLISDELYEVCNICSLIPSYLYFRIVISLAKPQITQQFTQSF